VVECVAPAKLHSDRFLPVTPIRVQVDHSGVDKSAAPRVDAEILRVGSLHKLLDQEKFRREIVPAMLNQCREIAIAKMEKVVAKAITESGVHLDREIDRLIALGEINDHVSERDSTSGHF